MYNHAAAIDGVHQFGSSQIGAVFKELIIIAGLIDLAQQFFPLEFDRIISKKDAFGSRCTDRAIYTVFVQCPQFWVRILEKSEILMRKNQPAVILQVIPNKMIIPLRNAYVLFCIVINVYGQTGHIRILSDCRVKNIEIIDDANKLNGLFHHH
jgi:hypothetical protein